MATGPIGTLSLIFQIVGWLVNIVLLVAGIGSLKLRPWARILMIRIMLFQYLILAVSIVFNVALVIPAVAKTAGQNPNLPTITIFYVTLFIAFAFGAVYPGLIIYFFSRPHVISAFEEPPPAQGFIPPP